MPKTDAIADVLKNSVEAGDVPGVIAVAADANGVFFEGAFGQRSLGGPTPMSADTIVRIASMTKAVTATCAMQLVEREKLALDEPIGALLPDLGTVQVFEGFDAGGGGAATLAGAKAADHSAASHDAHIGSCLRYMERQYHCVS